MASSNVVEVAGIRIEDPYDRLISFARGRRTGRTFQVLDLRSPTPPNKLTYEEVALTRSMDSRISVEEAARFVERGTTAPWSVLHSGVSLADADPDSGSGRRIIQNGLRIFAHFIDPRIQGIWRGKVHKVLHVKRPAFYPILDSRLYHLYATAAKEERATYPELVGPWLSVGHWLAFREDLVRAQRALDSLRSRLERSPASRELGIGPGETRRVTDVRLLDILAWSASD